MKSPCCLCICVSPQRLKAAILEPEETFLGVCICIPPIPAGQRLSIRSIHGAITIT
jgi:hypothetical protein